MKPKTVHRSASRACGGGTARATVDSAAERVHVDSCVLHAPALPCSVRLRAPYKAHMDQKHGLPSSSEDPILTDSWSFTRQAVVVACLIIMGVFAAVALIKL